LSKRATLFVIRNLLNDLNGVKRIERLERFERSVFWRYRVPIDPTKHYFDSKFEIKTTVHKQAEWRKNLAAAR
jgi:hypothetical protein